MTFDGLTPPRALRVGQDRESRMKRINPETGVIEKSNWGFFWVPDNDD